MCSSGARSEAGNERSTTAGARRRGARGGARSAASGVDGAMREASEGKRSMFQCKLQAMVERREVQWDETSRALVVRDAARFAVEVMPKYFKGGQFQSFNRQLNYYGFIRVPTSDSKAIAFINRDDSVRTVDDFQKLVRVEKAATRGEIEKVVECAPARRCKRPRATQGHCVHSVPQLREIDAGLCVLVCARCDETLSGPKRQCPRCSRWRAKAGFRGSLCDTCKGTSDDAELARALLDLVSSGNRLKKPKTQPRDPAANAYAAWPENAIAVQ
mmetsp:Transcript_16809/g.52535  ORF Transcript_16809/g.52535 Transcript_16809/m.52535 type:complete len:273 (-) Transcript_16809:314-1132(-)